MGVPYTFANHVGGAVPAQNLDDDFAYLFNLTSGTVSYANIAAVQAIADAVAAPPIIFTQGALTAGDGGGGSWVWNSTSVLTHNGATVIKLTAVATGRYLRNYSGPVSLAWLVGNTPGTAAANRAALVTLLGIGGPIEMPPGAGTWPISNGITQNVANTDFNLRGCTISSSAVDTQSGNFLIVDAGSIHDGTLLANDYATSLGIVLWLRGLNTTARRMTVTGNTFNPRLPNSYTGPAIGMEIGTSAGTTMMTGCIAEDIVINYCVDGLKTSGMQGCRLRHIALLNQSSQGVVLGLGLPLLDNNDIDDITSQGAGGYGIQWQNLSGLATTAGYRVPYRQNRLTRLLVKDCGYQSWQMGLQSTVGAGKTGFAFSTTDSFQQDVDITSINCANGGGEFKYTTIAAGSSIIPHGFLYGSLNAKIYTDTDVQYGVGLSHGAAGDVYTDNGRHTAKIDANYITPVPWQSQTVYGVWNSVSAGGYIWKCRGDGTGLGGRSGNTAPTGAAATGQLTTNGSSIVGGQLMYFPAASTSLITTGTVVLCGRALPDGATVDAIGATSIHVSAAFTSLLVSGSTATFNTEANDDSLYWLCYMADRQAAPTQSQAIYISPGNGTTVTGTIRGYNTAVALDCSASAENTIADFTAKGIDAKACVNGVVVSGGGKLVSAQILGCSFDSNNQGGAVNTGLWLQGGSHIINVVGTRFSARGSSNVGVAFLTTSSLNATVRFLGCELEGGAQAASLSTTGTYAINHMGTKFRPIASGAIPIALAGSGTWQFGASSELDGVDQTKAGYSILSGSIAVTGQVLRTDITINPTSKPAGIGEYVLLAVPTTGSVGLPTGIRGYYNISTAPNWRGIPLA